MFPHYFTGRYSSCTQWAGKIAQTLIVQKCGSEKKIWILLIHPSVFSRHNPMMFPLALCCGQTAVLGGRGISLKPYALLQHIGGRKAAELVSFECLNEWIVLVGSMQAVLLYSRWGRMEWLACYLLLHNGTWMPRLVLLLREREVTEPLPWAACKMLYPWEQHGWHRLMKL